MIGRGNVRRRLIVSLPPLASVLAAAALLLPSTPALAADTGSLTLDPSDTTLACDTGGLGSFNGTALITWQGEGGTPPAGITDSTVEISQLAASGGGWVVAGTVPVVSGSPTVFTVDGYDGSASTAWCSWGILVETPLSASAADTPTPIAPSGDFNVCVTFTTNATSTAYSTQVANDSPWWSFGFGTLTTDGTAGATACVNFSASPPTTTTTIAPTTTSTGAYPCPTLPPAPDASESALVSLCHRFESAESHAQIIHREALLAGVYLVFLGAVLVVQQWRR